MTNNPFAHALLSRINAVAAFLAAGIVLFAATATRAGVIVGPSSATTNMGEIDSTTPLSNLLNQSGLATSYVNGMTDFDTFTATQIHDRGLFSVNAWLSAANVRTGHVDFALGQTHQVESFALWNGLDPQGVKDFRLFVSADSTFTSLTLIGSFTATSSPTVTLPQVFQFTPTAAAYIRLAIDSFQGDALVTSIGEVAFEAAPAVAAVPEPATLTMVGLLAPALLVGLRRAGRVARP